MATLISLQDYKTFSGINNNKADAKLTLTIELVDSFIETYCGRVFTSATFTEQLPSSEEMIFVRNLPIDTVTTLSYYDTDIVLQEIDSSLFVVYKEEGSIELLSHTEIPLASISKPFTVVYTGGFTNTPKAMKLAAIDLVTYYHKRESQNKVSSTNINAEAVDIEDSHLPPHIKRVLDLYRVR